MMMTMDVEIDDDGDDEECERIRDSTHALLALEARARCTGLRRMPLMHAVEVRPF